MKFVRIAEGAADIAPRLGPTMEWDSAAGQAILEAAGGRVLAPDGQPLAYGKPGYLNSGFVALGAQGETA
jgi:3'(2'), 5'-bisphosphate nucleotidase